MTHPLSDVFRILTEAQRASQFANDQTGRVSYGFLAVVTENNDPDDKRRIQVASPFMPGLNTNWYRRLPSFPGFDPPVPQIGETVFIQCEEGDPTKGWYISPHNDTNPTHDKQDAVNDLSLKVPGNRVESIQSNHTETVGGNRDETVKGNHTGTIQGNYTETVNGIRSETVKQNATDRVDMNYVIDVGLSLTLKNTAGASLTLSAGGAIVLKDAFGNEIALGGASAGLGYATNTLWRLGSDMTWNFQNRKLNIINASDVTIAGKSAAVLGAVDSRGDTIVQKGWI